MKCLYSQRKFIQNIPNLIGAEIVKAANSSEVK